MLVNVNRIGNDGDSIKLIPDTESSKLTNLRWQYDRQIVIDSHGVWKSLAGRRRQTNVTNTKSVWFNQTEQIRVTRTASTSCPRIGATLKIKNSKFRTRFAKISEKVLKVHSPALNFDFQDRPHLKLTFTPAGSESASLKHSKGESDSFPSVPYCFFSSFQLLRDQQLMILILVLLLIDCLIVTSWATFDPMRRNLQNLTLEIDPLDRSVVYQKQVGFKKN